MTRIYANPLTPGTARLRQGYRGQVKEKNLQDLLVEQQRFLKSIGGWQDYQTKDQSFRLNDTDVFSILTPLFKFARHVISKLKNSRATEPEKKKRIEAIQKRLRQPIKANPFKSQFITVNQELAVSLEWFPNYQLLSYLSFDQNTVKLCKELTTQSGGSSIHDENPIHLTDQAYSFSREATCTQIHRQNPLCLMAQQFARHPHQTDALFQGLKGVAQLDEISPPNFIIEESRLSATTFDTILGVNELDPRYKLELCDLLLNKIDKAALPGIVARRIIEEIKTLDCSSCLKLKNNVLLTILEKSNDKVGLINQLIHPELQEDEQAFLDELSPDDFVNALSDWTLENLDSLSEDELLLLTSTSRKLNDVLDKKINPKPIKKKKKKKTKKASKKAKKEPSTKTLTTLAPQSQPNNDSGKISYLKHLVFNQKKVNAQKDKEAEKELLETLEAEHTGSGEAVSTKTAETLAPLPSTSNKPSRILDALLESNVKAVPYSQLNKEARGILDIVLSKIDPSGTLLSHSQFIKLKGSFARNPKQKDIDILAHPSLFVELRQHIAHRTQMNECGILSDFYKHGQCQMFKACVRTSQTEMINLDITKDTLVLVDPSAAAATEAGPTVSTSDWLNDAQNLLRLLKIFRDVYISTSETRESELDELKEAIINNIKINELQQDYRHRRTYVARKVLFKFLCSVPKAFYQKMKEATFDMFNEARVSIEKSPLIETYRLGLYEALINETPTNVVFDYLSLKQLMGAVSDPSVSSTIHHRLTALCTQSDQYL